MQSMDEAPYLFSKLIQGWRLSQLTIGSWVHFCIHIFLGPGERGCKFAVFAISNIPNDLSFINYYSPLRLLRKSSINSGKKPSFKCGISTNPETGTH